MYVLTFSKKGKCLTKNLMQPSYLAFQLLEEFHDSRKELKAEFAEQSNHTHTYDE